MCLMRWTKISSGESAFTKPNPGKRVEVMDAFYDKYKCGVEQMDGTLEALMEF